MECPRCGSAMEEVTLEGHLGRPIAIDLCASCQAFWFDDRESLRLSPASTLRLFRRIGELASPPAMASGPAPRCPRCRGPLRLTRDMQRTTRFEYLKCPGGHGRFTTFFNFLREKDFIRPLSAEQIAVLRESVETVNCSNCGAPIDLAHEQACRHCGSPLSMLDSRHAEALVQQLRDADRSGDGVDPLLPLARERARRQTHAGFDAFERDDAWMRDASSSGLVTAGLQSLARWLTRQV